MVPSPLVRLSDELPEFLERRRRARGWHVDLARLERARYRVLEHDDDPPLEEAGLRAIPADAWLFNRDEVKTTPTGPPEAE